MFRSTLVLIILCNSLAWSQEDTRDKYQLAIQRTTSEIILDGKLDEDVWSSLEPVKNFQNQWPLDSGLAEAKTEVRMTYDNDFLYLAAVCYDDGERVVQSLKRDNEGHWNSDGFTVTLDPINERSSGFMFGVNAGGAQMEGVLTINSWGTDGDRNWDNKWYSKVENFDDRWQVEMAIPFKTLRYKAQNQLWGVNFIRNDMSRNVYSTWTQFPLNFAAIELGYNGVMTWDAPPPQVKGKFTVIPYVSGGISKNHEDEESTKSDLDAGLDAKIAVTSSLNLDLTVNPDFSNVDVDQQVTNLSRFSLFFPERRNFFLENSDLFTNFGKWNARPFFSRRIGLSDGSPVPITYGARLSGNLSNKLRIGVMDVQTRATEDQNAQNYAVAAFQYQVLKRSKIKGLFVNRQSTTQMENIDQDDHNRIGGLEFEYLSQDGRWSGLILHHRSYMPGETDKNGFTSGRINYNARNMFFGFEASEVQENFVADAGFTPRINNYDGIRDTTVRIGYKEINPWVGYNFYPKNNKNINRHGPRSWAVWTLNPDGSLNERIANFVYFINYASGSEIRFRIFNDEVQLPFAIDLIGDDKFLPAGRYNFTDYSFNYTSNTRKRVSGGGEIRYGSFYNGTKFTFSSNMNVRFQPWGNFGITYTQNKVDLTEEFGATDLHLVGATAEISFSNKMFWTTFVQYNTQGENLNINSRFQWRYKPMSDLFVVYSDNYVTTDFGVKNRGIVFKINYWLNL